MLSVRFLYGWHGEDGLEGSVARIRCAVVLGRGGIEASGIPSFVGIGLHCIRDSPPAVVGDFASGIPHSAAAGALAQQRKKFKRATKGPSCFLYTVIPYASRLATVCQCTKKALKRCLRAFFPLLCGERGIRTPGTVTRTSV